LPSISLASAVKMFLKYNPAAISIAENIAVEGAKMALKMENFQIILIKSKFNITLQ
jgi:hypothetical protein